jgi:flagellar motor switch protein FliG
MPTAAAVPEKGVSVRNAAIVLVALGEQASANIVKHLPRPVVQRVGEEISRLGVLSLEEVTSVLEGFHHAVSPGHSFGAGGPHYTRKMLFQAFGREEGEKIFNAVGPAADPSATALNPALNTDPQKLARVMESEHPQTCALLLSQLDPAQGAAVLARLSSETRVDVALRIARLQTISTKVTHTIAGRIVQKLGTLADVSRQPYQGVKAMAELLNRMPAESSDEILNRLSEDNEAMATEVRNLLFTFDDIVKLDGNAVREVVGRVDRKVLTLALKGTGEKLQGMVFSTMSQSGAAMMREDMEALGPVRIKDVQDAQQEIIGVLRQLEKEGVLSLRGSGGGDGYVS